MTDDDKPDWSRIPRRLAFMIEPAKQYGHIQFEAEVEAFDQSASAAQRAELRALARRLWEERDCEDGHAVVEWVVKQDLAKHAEAARIEFLMMLLQRLGYC